MYLYPWFVREKGTGKYHKSDQRQLTGNASNTCHLSNRDHDGYRIIHDAFRSGLIRRMSLACEERRAWYRSQAS